MEFRKATVSDHQEIVSIYKTAIKAMADSGINQWDDIYPSADILLQDIENAEMHLGIIDGIVAVAYTLNKSYDPQYDNGSWSCEGQSFSVLHRICVNPLFQNKGVATLAGKHIEEFLKSEGTKSIRLDAFSLNPGSLKLYNKLGYIKVGETRFRKGLFYLFEKKL